MRRGSIARAYANTLAADEVPAAPDRPDKIRTGIFDTCLKTFWPSGPSFESVRSLTPRRDSKL